MNCLQIVLKQELKNVTLKQELKQFFLKNVTPQIIIRGGPIVANILQFSVQATENGQTIFVLPYTYNMIICLFIMGTGQDPITGDYMLSGNTVILGLTAPYINSGDLIFGAGQM